MKSKIVGKAETMVSGIMVVGPPDEMHSWESGRIWWEIQAEYSRMLKRHPLHPSPSENASSRDE